jgi:hypothetical protein
MTGSGNITSLGHMLTGAPLSKVGILNCISYALLWIRLVSMGNRIQLFVSRWTGSGSRDPFQTDTDPDPGQSSECGFRTIRFHKTDIFTEKDSCMRENCVCGLIYSNI